MTKFVAYYRVSTTKQGRSGLGLEAQRESVTRFAELQEVIASYTEVESGRRKDRPQLALAIAHAKREDATLIIAKLDRLARNVHFISGLMEAKVKFIACDNPHANKLTLHILAAVAETEADMISKRIKEALAVARAKGKKLGGFRGRMPDNRKQMQEAQAFAEGMRPIIKELADRGIVGYHPVARELNRLGLKARCGRRWGVMQVCRVMERLIKPPKIEWEEGVSPWND